MKNCKVDEFWNKRSKIKDPTIAANFRYDNRNQFDIDFINKLTPKYAKILDLGCGTCRLTNELAEKAKYICAVDKQASFLQFCKKSHKINTVIADIVDYCDNYKYDIIIIFGVMQYFSIEEACIIYRNCYNMLDNEGKLVVKHNCGVKEDVIIDKYSEELQDWYYSYYRQYDLEKNLIEKQGFRVTMHDIYPPEINRWDNTHFYAFVGTKQVIECEK